MTNNFEKSAANANISFKTFGSGENNRSVTKVHTYSPIIQNFSENLSVNQSPRKIEFTINQPVGSGIYAPNTISANANLLTEGIGGLAIKPNQTVTIFFLESYSKTNKIPEGKEKTSATGRSARYTENCLALFRLPSLSTNFK